MRSLADLMVSKRRPPFAMDNAFLFPTWGGRGLRRWTWCGRTVYDGPAKGGVRAVPAFSSFFIRYRNGTAMPICLPAEAMVKFERES